MDNALINPNDLINQGVDSPDAGDNLPVGITFLPNLTVAYPTSKSVVEKEIARAGEFVLGGQTSLGKEIEAVSLDYRRHAGYQKDDWSMESEIFHFSNQGDVRNNEAYQKFINNCPEGLTLLDGADIFLYLPERSVYCTIFLKKSLYKFANPIVNQGVGGRVLKISTARVEGTGKLSGKSWYNLSVAKTNRALVGSALSDVDASVSYPADKLNEAVVLWRKPAAVESTDEKVDDVAR